ncbi:unnamed protein product [Mycena citricolor]|uniref:RNA-binding protein VTS1 n=1 Tax=Mycena citricolor TaxID=2018698 RepID=A0AAD2K8A5_9AGAR|nr:unnamed protein product [Mycena citricolor]CAK5284485.1 unnamed protein product [Mycena citricolor]
MSLRPPSSPSPSPGPENGKQHARQSLGPSARGTPMAPGSPRLGGTGTRPTSELVGSAGMYQTPEAEALDQWFENLQNYEATLEDMAAASLDANFKEELSAIEQWFKVLSEAERTAALYSLLQHSTQVQIRFFITVLQQMARSDPMTALLSPAVGGSMQAQMEAKLASLKSPGLKSGLPQSPTARSFNPSSPAANRQSLIETPNNYLSPDSAVLGQSQEAANTLAQQRAKLKAANAAHRISAPIMPTTSGSNTWGAGGLGQVVETTARAPSPSAEEVSSRPKSTEFTSTRAPVAAQEASLPSHAASESWASMVTTPLPMFAKTEPKEPSGQAEWRTPGGPAIPGVPRMGDPTIHRRGARQTPESNNFDDNAGNFGARGNGRWNATSPSSNRFGSDDGSNPGGGSNNGRSNNGMGPLGMGGFGMGMGMNGAGAMGGMNPFGVNMNMLAMGISPETQLLAAQMAQAQMAAAASGGAFGMGGAGWLGMQGQGMHPGGMNRMMRPPSARTPKTASTIGSSNGMGGGALKGDEDVDPALLTDIPAWLRSLRLHKYTPNFEGANWKDMVMMDEAALEAKGVAALGARRKMLKTFEIVRKKMGIEGGPPMSADA